ncbi:uncharacterized protein G2W53_011606 [Senna tora]|uniref:Uncharacterized protein n=1 Tax=Senna tora TaxID=362788 RepID=A0A835CFD4_9FABA|nr:uncharacterized protein G2W53_011606 [Senna tora]
MGLNHVGTRRWTRAGTCPRVSVS